jgi:hypothetical protein
MKKNFFFIFAVFSFQIAFSQQVSGIYKVNKSSIVILNQKNASIYQFQLKINDSSSVTINDHILLIPTDSILIYLGDNWVKKNEFGKKIYQMETSDFLENKCSIELENSRKDEWRLKIIFPSFSLQYELEQY